MLAVPAPRIGVVVVVGTALAAGPTIFPTVGGLAMAVISACVCVSNMSKRVERAKGFGATAVSGGCRGGLLCVVLMESKVLLLHHTAVGTSLMLAVVLRARGVVARAHGTIVALTAVPHGAHLALS